MKKLPLTKIRFPEINLKTRDAHHLRGYFGRLFEQHSPLLHNHYDSGNLRYAYPLVQYKVLNNVPTLVALDEGAELLTKLFLKMTEIHLNGKSYDITNKQIEQCIAHTGYSEDLHEYEFSTLWMALNQDNYNTYRKADSVGRKKLLTRILVGNVLSFFKYTDIQLEKGQQLMGKVFTEERTTKFKNRNMVAFKGRIVINAELPNDIGIGKGVSRGFGAIRKIG